MTAWIFPAFILIIFSVIIALFLRYKNLQEIKAHVRKIGMLTISVLAFICLSIVVLIYAFSYASEFFTSVLSADFIADSRLILKVLFGSESVFTSLQMLGALSLFLFSFASFASCILFVCIFLIRNFSSDKNGVEDCPEKVESVPGCFSIRRFAILSRYLL